VRRMGPLCDLMRRVLSSHSCETLRPKRCARQAAVTVPWFATEQLPGPFQIARLPALNELVGGLVAERLGVDLALWWSRLRHRRLWRYPSSAERCKNALAAGGNGALGT
jgi:hypothetical protein